MRKLWLLAIMGLATFTLVGCNCNVDVNNTSKEAKDFCLNKGGTYSRITSPDEEYGECVFPSGIGCRDEYVLNGECEYEADTSDIDTEEKRLAGCEENAQWWVKDFVEWTEDVSVEWWEESEGWASFVRDGVITYTKDGVEQKIKAECIADFVDGSIGVHYDEMDINDQEVATEEITE